MSVTAARGFRAGAATAGLKPSGRPDIALVVNDGPLDAVAAVFTANRARAHPVLWSEQVVRSGSARALAVNAGNANCYTGPPGFLVTHRTAEHVAALLSTTGREVAGGDVVVCSTGIIGVPLDERVVLAGMSAAAAALGDDEASSVAAAEAIRTTDTRTKQAVRHEDGWTVGGIAKGAGMLAPGLATMLVHLTTDAGLDAAALDRALRAATRVTFDRLDSDGCMSTNDTVTLMASGAAGAAAPSEDRFTEVLTGLCHDLALQLLADAEGAEHDVAIRVTGAAREDDAVEVGRAVARSALVKTAVFGRDPNWGRVLAAVGTTSAAFDPLEVDVSVNGVQVCRAGGPGEDRSGVDLVPRWVDLVIDLHAGAAEATVWTNDLTHAYVHENSAYTT
ncbi:bifunctional glutamate N-acetyltransferase/amino-acid acetyltransferase ArgJ [Aquipuribacter sp. SD81]|uniref:bifunctional glutamate N-acetyltransferase/amino-acid acetyltransferase ArgJ n=1 Tax=Aquipuribacter sp. SD81 TaxID=3127703 RepID=UPI0030196AF3